MLVYLNCTANLGDFVQSLPVLSGVHREYGPIEFYIRHEMRKFLGLKEFLMYQGIFSGVYFDDEEREVKPPVHILSSWTREDRAAAHRPIETCRYENWLKDNYRLKFEVDDKFLIQYPKLDIELKDTYYVGDRWWTPDIDARREVNVLSYLSEYEFLDYENPILTNCYIIKESPRPFITNFTGVGMIADLLDKECYVVWRAEDWLPEFRRGRDISWDNGKNIQMVFEKHFYLDRHARLVHADDLKALL
jgi:hypothetical protein